MTRITFRGNVVLPAELLPRGVVVVENGRIVAVGHQDEVKVPAGAEVIDAQDGYIHFSTAEQLAETLSLHFKGQTGLVLFRVRSFDIGSKLVWEPSRGGELFPHVYGSFPMSAVTWQGTVDVGPDGGVTLPAEVV